MDPREDFLVVESSRAVLYDSSSRCPGCVLQKSHSMFPDLPSRHNTLLTTPGAKVLTFMTCLYIDLSVIQVKDIVYNRFYMIRGKCLQITHGKYFLYVLTVVICQKMKYAQKVIKLNFSSIKFKICVYQCDGIPAQLSKINYVHKKKKGLFLSKLILITENFFQNLLRYVCQDKNKIFYNEEKRS